MTAGGTAIIFGITNSKSVRGGCLMTPYRVRVEAASRLHLGLLSLGQAGHRQFGGVGLMVDSPGLELLAEPSAQWTYSGTYAERLGEFAARWRRNFEGEITSGCHLRLLRSPPQHVGLGTGTQLGLAVAAALYRIYGSPLPAAQTLAEVVGRGRRSSVGTHGFLLGGLIVDRGKLPREPLGQLAARVELPPEWRVVQIRPLRQSGLSGSAERRAFDRLPAIELSVTERLWRRVQEELLPAARAGDIERFGEAVYQYGYEAGLCFAVQQGGPFASPLLAGWVAGLRRRGVLGVGQSSWGPTLFAFASSQVAAEELVEWARRELAKNHPVELRISRINDRGARIGAEVQSSRLTP
jgi:beta-RFAP synthase